MQINATELLANLKVLRQVQGEEAYAQAVDSLGLMLLKTPSGEEFLKTHFPDLDLERLRGLAAQAAANQQASSLPNDMLALIRTHVPHLQTQAQLDLFMTAFNAFTLTFDSYYAGKAEDAAKARDIMNRGMDLAQNLGRVAEMVEEIPVERRSVSSAQFVEPPKQFTEVDEKAALMSELDAITNQSELNDWYRNERKRIDGVVSKTLRDELFDAIRAKQIQYAN